MPVNAPDTYECHTEDCDEIVRTGDEVFFIGGRLYCRECVPVPTC